MLIRNDASRAPPCGRSRGRSKSLTLCLALASLGAASAAQAATVDLMYEGSGSGRILQLSVGTQSRTMFAGRLVHSTSNGTTSMAGLPANITTFSVEFLQGLAVAPSIYNSSSIATLSGNTGITNLGFAKQQAIYDVYHAAAGREFTQGPDYAAAFQVAIWKIVYDYSAVLPNHGLDLTGGHFHATMQGESFLSASITDDAAILLGAVGTGSGSGGLMGLESGSFQDQLYVSAIPLPSAAWMGLGGLGLVAGRHWLKRRA